MAVTSMANSSIRDFTKFNRMSIAYPAEGDHVWDEEAGDWIAAEVDETQE